MEEWFPKNTSWGNIRKFILESGVNLTDEVNPKWLSGYTNIGISHKPHHIDEYTRKMEESMFMLHDVVHNIFTLNTECDKEEYVKRQIYGEFFTFYLTEYMIPSYWEKDIEYREQRGCFHLMFCLLWTRPNKQNIIDYMEDVFIGGVRKKGFLTIIKDFGQLENLEKYSKMFKEDLENSGKNYDILPKNIKNHSIVGPTSKNHMDMFDAISKGSIKNTKREFDLKLPEQWI